jgi:hypothetical protein
MLVNSGKAVCALPVQNKGKVTRLRRKLKAARKPKVGGIKTKLIPHKDPIIQTYALWENESSSSSSNPSCFCQRGTIRILCRDPSWTEAEYAGLSKLQDTVR